MIGCGIGWRSRRESGCRSPYGQLFERLRAQEAG